MSGMQMLDDQGNVIAPDNFDELTALFNKTEIPGDELTGEIGGDKGEDDPPPPAVDPPEPKKDDPAEPPKDVVDPAVDPNKDTPPADKDTPANVDADKVPADNVSELTTKLRDQEKQIALLTAKLNRLEKRPIATPPKDPDDLDLDDPADPKPEELEQIELYQQEITKIATEKEEHFNELIALMELSPKFSDVQEVCTRERFEDIFDAAAQAMVEKEGVDFVTAQLAVELSVWKKPNPYAFMYPLIKKHHPDFREKPAGTADPAKPEPATPVKDTTPVKKEPEKSPLSALDLGRSGGKDAGQWTAERIDAMPESELSKVPADVYEKYLAGELDK